VALGSTPRFGAAQAPHGALGHGKGPNYLRFEVGPNCLGFVVIYLAQCVWRDPILLDPNEEF